MSSNETPTQFSLVIPVYRNEGTIGMLIESSRRLHDRLQGMLQVVFVVDGSPTIRTNCSNNNCRTAVCAELVSLSRNFGSFAAVRMGLTAARGPYFAVMAADLQEPPELVEEFFRIPRRSDRHYRRRAH